LKLNLMNLNQASKLLKTLASKSLIFREKSKTLKTAIILLLIQTSSGKYRLSAALKISPTFKFHWLQLCQTQISSHFQYNSLWRILAS
jgi:hypothetical protein